MNSKVVLYELCKIIQQEIDERGDSNSLIKKVELIVHIKPADYYLPQTTITTSTAIDKSKMALFVEIYGDDRCLIREYHVIDESEDINVIEEHLSEKVARTILRFGLFSIAKLYNKYKKD